MKRARWIAAAAALILALGAGWWFGSPWWTLRQIKVAAEARDGAALSAYVDYPALKADAVAQLRERFLDGGISQGAADLFVIGTMAEGVIDAVTRPEGMEAIFAAGSTGRIPLNMRAEDMTIRRDSIDQFRLVRKDGTGGELLFRRDGLGWKLSGVRVPKDLNLLR